MDSDESYLLRSYNENEPLFSNIPVLKQREFYVENNQKQSRKKTNDNEKSCFLVNESYDNIGFRRVLDSICEDFVEDQKSATKTGSLKNKNQNSEMIKNKKNSNMKSK